MNQVVHFKLKPEKPPISPYCSYCGKILKELVYIVYIVKKNMWTVLKKFKKNYGYKCKKLPHLLNKTYSLPKESDLSLTKVAILRQLTKYCIYQSTSKWFLMPKLFQTWKRFYIKVFGIEQKITSLSNIPYSTY